MTPLFVGSEPVIARSGKFKGVQILQEEQSKAVARIDALTGPQHKKAILESSRAGDNCLAHAFKDNLALDYADIKTSELDSPQTEELIGLVSVIGGTEPNSIFYYHIHSPVILIEFDHQQPVGLRHLASDPKAPNRGHIHAVVRTRNGNDYGKDLLRQHYEQQPHTNCGQLQKKSSGGRPADPLGALPSAMPEMPQPLLPSDL